MSNNEGIRGIPKKKEIHIFIISGGNGWNITCFLKNLISQNLNVIGRSFFLWVLLQVQRVHLYKPKVLSLLERVVFNYILYTIGLKYGCVEMCPTLCLWGITQWVVNCQEHNLAIILFPKKGDYQKLSGLEAAQTHVHHPNAICT